MKICWIPRIPEKKSSSAYRLLIFPILKRFLLVKQVTLILCCKFELVFIQRYFIKEFLLKILRKRNAVIIFDFDDAIYLDQPGKNVNQKKTDAILKIASHVIVSAGELETYCRLAGCSNVTRITTPIDAGRFHPYTCEPKSHVVIGWIGSPYTARFLKVIESALEELHRLTPFKLLVVGAGKDFTLPGIEMEVVPWDYDTEPSLIERMDIGIMPLPNEDYAKGKGGYKIFQYMAAALPVVASPVGINADIIENGRNGFLAESREEWINSLSTLIKNPLLRTDFGKAGRLDVMKYYNRDVCFEKLAHILKTELIKSNELKTNKK